MLNYRVRLKVPEAFKRVIFCSYHFSGTLNSSFLQMP